MFVYIGELCRYLANQPEAPEETPAQAAAGVRQRPAARRLGEDDRTFRRAADAGVLRLHRRQRLDVQLRRQAGRDRPRAGLPEALLQHPAGAGSTSRPRRRCAGRTAAASRPRRTRRASASARSRTTRATAYVGYADKAASEKKVLHDAFRAGDAWFRTGDLLQEGRRGLLLFRRPHRRHLPLEGRERLHQRGGRRAGRRAGRQGGQRLRRQGGRPRRPRRHGRAGGGRRLRRQGVRRLRRPAAAGLRPAGVPAPAARRSRSPAPSSTASSTWWPRASTRPWSRTRSTSAAPTATRS